MLQMVFHKTFVFFKRFKKIDELLAKLPPPLPEFVNYVRNSHRPYFTELFLKCLTEGWSPEKSVLDQFEGACRSMGETLWNAKFHLSGFKLGQIRMFQPSFIENERKAISSLIRGHFANLHLGSSSGVTELSVEELPRFNPSAIFPKTNAEVLLYLSLMGPTRDLETTANGSSPSQSLIVSCLYLSITYLYISLSLSLCRVSTKTALLETRYDSVPAINNKGSNRDELEALLETAVCVASHYGGFGGLSVFIFFL